MLETAFLTASHRRWNPLKQEWVLVSPNRTQRPWQGQIEERVQPTTSSYDPACYLCPGNARAGGQVTPPYLETFVFENDFAALSASGPDAHMDVADAGLIRAETESGVCRVVCFDPRHDRTLATLELPAVRRVVDIWSEQSAELGARKDITYVQIFENRGSMMGASNPHPHGQIWATQQIPNEPRKELLAQREYLEQYQHKLLDRYLALELEARERIVLENDLWVALVPFWAIWPFEVLLLPRDSVSRIEDLTHGQRDGFAAALQGLTSAYDRVFNTPFPYSMGIHPAPYDGVPHPEWQLHVHFYPPLLRSASIRKFMVGFELLGSPQRDITAESAAEMLRTAFASI